MKCEIIKNGSADQMDRPKRIRTFTGDLYEDMKTDRFVENIFLTFFMASIKKI